jgi:hypothetical protein
MNATSQIIANKHNQHTQNLCTIDARLDELAKWINIIRDYNNPFQDITFKDNLVEVSIELTPDILTSDEIVKKQIAVSGNKSNAVQAILSKYSILDHSKKYRITFDLPLETKINMLYAEKLNYAREYVEKSLPIKYVTLFKENECRNIYNKVRQELLEEINVLVAKKIELLSNNRPNDIVQHIEKVLYSNMLLHSV